MGVGVSFALVLRCHANAIQTVRQKDQKTMSMEHLSVTVITVAGVLCAKSLMLIVIKICKQADTRD
jgi:hypothetical protein